MLIETLEGDADGVEVGVDGLERSVERFEQLQALIELHELHGAKGFDFAFDAADGLVDRIHLLVGQFEVVADPLHDAPWQAEEHCSQQRSSERAGGDAGGDVFRLC